MTGSERQLRGLSPSVLVLMASLLVGVATVAPASPAVARSSRSTARCCFEFSVQAGGAESVDYGDGTGAYPFFRGRYSARWQFAFRVLLKLEHTDRHYELNYVGPYRFRTRSHPKVALHDWVVDWSFTDTPEGVQKSCCYTQMPHGWESACTAKNSDLGSNGFSEEHRASPRFGFSGSRLAVSVDRPTPRAGFQCGLNDGRLDGVLPGSLIWDANQLKRPSLRRLLHGTDFAQTCTESASFGPDGGIRIVASTGTQQVRARFRYFPKSRLYESAKRLDELVGTNPPGFEAPSEPNTGDHCTAG